MRAIFLIPALSLAVTAAVATHLGWNKEATLIGGLAFAGCLTLVAIGIGDTVRERLAEGEVQQRGTEHGRQAEHQRAAEEITRASPQQPRGATAVRSKKQRVSAQPKKSRASAKPAKKEPGRTPS
jgi:hypothetical protein